MRKQKHGHIVNISSIGVQTSPPRFSAYVASKAALDAWSNVVSSELVGDGISFTSIHMPLVRTPMIAPTKIYTQVPTLAPEEAADLVAEAIVYKPVRIATRLGVFGEVLHALLPRVAQVIMNTTFRMFPDSASAAGKKEEVTPAATPDMIAMSNLMRGIHF
jgi:NAD(P)-dependent dehydrogenase (short-subunit alcohol dehydrogenase family)